IGRYFYSGLRLPWVPDLLADQRLGGGLAWATGEIPMLIVVVAMVAQWSRVDERAARRGDRKADRDGDADLVAYNAMLRQMAGESVEAPGGAPGNAVTPSRTAPVDPVERSDATSDVSGARGAAERG